MPFHQKTRCTGHCCRLIRIGGLSIEKVVSMAIEADDVEAATVADMLRPYVGERPFEELEGHPLPLWIVEADRYFTCRHFDGTSCGIYERRPSMCAGYPYGRACKVTGCTWEPAEAALVSGVINQSPGRLRPRPHVEELVRIERRPKIGRASPPAPEEAAACEPAA